MKIISVSLYPTYKIPGETKLMKYSGSVNIYRLVMDSKKKLTLLYQTSFDLIYYIFCIYWFYLITRSGLFPSIFFFILFVFCFLFPLLISFFLPFFFNQFSRGEEPCRPFHWEPKMRCRDVFEKSLLGFLSLNRPGRERREICGVVLPLDSSWDKTVPETGPGLNQASARSICRPSASGRDSWVSPPPSIVGSQIWWESVS